MSDERPATRTELLELLATNQQQILTAFDTKLAAFDSKLAFSLASLKSEILLQVPERIDAAELRSRQHTEHIETRLLTAFHHWASPVDHRLRKLESSDSGVLERLAMVEARLTNLELKG